MPTELPREPTIRPIHAAVELNYLIGEETENVREVTATLFWPRPGVITHGEATMFSETQNATIRFRDIQDFLEHSGHFRVNDFEPYYARVLDAPDPPISSDAITVKFDIAGQNPDSKFSGTLRYQKSGYLYRLAGLAWPGIG